MKNIPAEVLKKNTTSDLNRNFCQLIEPQKAVGIILEFELERFHDSYNFILILLQKEFGLHYLLVEPC